MAKRPSSQPGNDSPDAERDRTQSAAPADSNPTRAPKAPADKQWREHEHRVDLTPAESKRPGRVEAATGSHELAEHAIDRLHADYEESRLPQEKVHGDGEAASRGFGFSSFDELLKASVAFPTERGRTLRVCEVQDGRWIRFQTETWPQHESFVSREDAMAVPQDE